MTTRRRGFVSHACITWLGVEIDNNSSQTPAAADQYLSRRFNSSLNSNFALVPQSNGVQRDRRQIASE